MIKEWFTNITEEFKGLKPLKDGEERWETVDGSHFLTWKPEGHPLQFYICVTGTLINIDTQNIVGDCGMCIKLADLYGRIEE